MGHVRGWDDLIVVACTVRRPSCIGEPAIEESCPLGDNELPVWSVAELPSCLAIGVSVDDDDGAIVGLAARFGLRELRRVERAVTAATNNDDVPQRISLPPSTTRIVPVT